MILKSRNLENTEVTLKTHKKTGIQYISPKEFAKYKKDTENAGGIVSVVRNTRLKKVKDQNQCNDEYIEADDIKYQLKDEKNKPAKGYIHVGDNRFVRFERNLFPLILLLLLAAALIAICLLHKTPETISRPHAGGEDYVADTQQSSAPSQESTTIPGYAKIKADKTASIIKLYNPKENTVNFVYMITDEPSVEDVKTCSSIDEAQKYIDKRKNSYTNYYDKNQKKYELKAEDGSVTDTLTDYKIVQDESSSGSYTVQKSSAKVLFFTERIAPGKCIKWDAYKALKTKGLHNVQFIISTYDVDTDEACTGSTQNVDITIK